MATERNGLHKKKCIFAIVAIAVVVAAVVLKNKTYFGQFCFIFLCTATKQFNFS